MTLAFKEILSERKIFIDEEIEKYFSARTDLEDIAGFSELKRSILYSVSRGGKRFRPIICLLIAETMGVTPQKILPIALAIEFIHTYSLIHDDLPMMDNDDFRRGEPTNHKVFGEDTALLAGDALLTEAFSVIAEGFASEPKLGLQIVKLLSEAAGYLGMVGGQAIDMKAKKQLPDYNTLIRMQEMKTGALITFSSEASARACGLSDEKVILFKTFGQKLGFAFQIADDLLDSTEGHIEKGSLPDLLGLHETRALLEETSLKAKEILKDLKITHGPLFDLIDYNLHRGT